MGWHMGELEREVGVQVTPSPEKHPLGSKRDWVTSEHPQEAKGKVKVHLERDGRGDFCSVLMEGASLCPRSSPQGGLGREE